MDALEQVKKVVGKKAAELVTNNMIVGLGTGSTAKWAILELIQRVKKGLKIAVVATSKASNELAIQGGLEVLDINQLSSIDITLDGADEVDPQGQIIKGAGGALFREKIIASMSKRLVILIDESKLVQFLGEKKPLPLEILPFGIRWIHQQIINLGFQGQWRKATNGLYQTDNGNFIFDVQLSQGDVKKQINAFLNIPGVLETGLFLNLATEVIIGNQQGAIQHKKL